MNLKSKIGIGAVAASLALSANATERLFTYSYEPETMPQGGWEVEQWVTLEAGRTPTVGQDHYNRWAFRTELEFGVTDYYTASLYLNSAFDNYRDPHMRRSTHNFHWEGMSLENKVMIVNPATHAVGVALYLEPRYDGEAFELEEKIIIGQRCGDWKWALNLTHATEWENNFDQKEGEVEVSAGLTRLIGKHWAVGLEARDHNELPEYKIWENSALYIGPVVSYRQERWWATLTVMPQIWGDTFHNQNPDRNSGLELEGHERWNVRLIAGVTF